MRTTVFNDGRPRVQQYRIQGYLTKTGQKKFEEARARLAALTGRNLVGIGDGDVVEYLARGEDATIKYLKSS